MNSATWAHRVREELSQRQPNRDKLYALSQEMHDHEASGYIVDPEEDTWWIRLTTYLER